MERTKEMMIYLSTEYCGQVTVFVSYYWSLYHPQKSSLEPYNP